jgi:hypothetical protein
LAVSDFSCDIAEKSRVNEVAEIDTVLLEEPELGLELELLLAAGVPLLEQAASARPAPMASVDVQLILVNIFKQITSPLSRVRSGDATSRPSARRSLRPGSDQNLKVR